jgi:hypothetical protein
MITPTGALIAIFVVVFLVSLGLLRLGLLLDAQERTGTPLRTEWPDD